MKKLTAISLFIFWALITALLTAGLVLHQNNKPTTDTTQTGTPATVLTLEEVAQHNNTSDCWLLIEKRVYDVTTYINQHPGNADTIIPACGTDATKAYDTKGRSAKPQPHSQNAHELLKSFYIGDLGQRSAPTSPTPAVPQTTQVQGTPPTKSTPAGSMVLSSQEIAKHSLATDCWLIVNGNVYNVTSYLGKHPGGRSAIIPYCGKDGTAAFEGLPHSTNAHQILAAFHVGAVGKQATTQAAQQTTNPVIPASDDGDREFEDD